MTTKSEILQGDCLELMKDIPMQTGDKELDSQVEELADYLFVNCPDQYEAIVLFGKSRYLQGSLKARREAIERIEDGNNT